MGGVCIGQLASDLSLLAHLVNLSVHTNMWDAWAAFMSRFPFIFTRVRGPGFDLRFHTALDPYWERFCNGLGHAATAEDAQRFLRSWGSDVVYLWLVGFLDRSEDSGRITDDTGWLQWPLKGSRLHAPSNAPPFAQCTLRRGTMAGSKRCGHQEARGRPAATAAKGAASRPPRPATRRCAAPHGSCQRCNAACLVALQQGVAAAACCPTE